MEQKELEIIISRIVINFLPRKKEEGKQFKDISDQKALQFLCPPQVISNDEIPKAKRSILKKNYKNRFQDYASQYSQLYSSFLTRETEELKRQILQEDIAEYFQNSMLFGSKDDKEYLKRAISAYWNDDYLVSSHLFIPLIESAIRKLVENCIGTDGYDKYSLRELLFLCNQVDTIKNIFPGAGGNMALYFQLILIKEKIEKEEYGMNWRNDFAHGLNKKQFFEGYISDQLFHIMLCLSLVKKEENKWRYAKVRRLDFCQDEFAFRSTETISLYQLTQRRAFRNRANQGLLSLL